jgi:hypothetical protein
MVTSLNSTSLNDNATNQYIKAIVT